MQRHDRSLNERRSSQFFKPTSPDGDTQFADGSSSSNSSRTTSPISVPKPTLTRKCNFMPTKNPELLKKIELLKAEIKNCKKQMVLAVLQKTLDEEEIPFQQILYLTSGKLPLGGFTCIDARINKIIAILLETDAENLEDTLQDLMSYSPTAPLDPIAPKKEAILLAKESIMLLKTQIARCTDEINELKQPKVKKEIAPAFLRKTC